MFQVKDFRSIVAAMLNVARASQSKITDFSVGSVARTLMEAPAVEMEELYLQMLLGLQDAIPVAIYQAFDFPELAAAPASGLVTIEFADPLDAAITLPAATVFEAPDAGLTFYSTAAVTAAEGATQVLVTVRAGVPGVVGNVDADAITQTGAALPDGYTLSNPAFTSGVDAESDVARKTRFVQFVASLARATEQSIRSAAASATVTDGGGSVQEYVTRVGIDEQVGHVAVYLYGSAGAPSAELIANAQKIIDGYIDPETGNAVSGYRAAGVEVAVSAMSTRAVSLSVSVATLPGVQQGSTLSAAVVAAIEAAIADVEPGGLLRADAVVGAALSVDGVLACYLGNDSNEVCGPFEVLTPGSITVTWLPNA